MSLEIQKPTFFYQVPHFYNTVKIIMHSFCTFTVFYFYILNLFIVRFVAVPIYREFLP
jgi:hypothetical protein